MDKIREFIETELSKVIFTLVALALTVLVLIITGALVNRFIRKKETREKGRRLWPSLCKAFSAMF